MRIGSERCHPVHFKTFDSAAKFGIRTKEEINDSLRFHDKIYT
jgi:hypothetical protein